MKALVYTIAGLALSQTAFSQDCEKVLFSGKVVDTLRPQSFYNLMIVNKNTGQGVFGQPNGKFSVYAHEGDSIALSVRGYPLKMVVVHGDENCQSKNTVYIEGKTQELDPVVVRPLKSLEEIKEERAALALRETRMVTGIDALQSPITALYQAFSKKERTKRWIAEQEYKDDQRKVLKELLRTYVAYDIVELTDEELEEFIYFLNMDDDFLKTASEMELIIFIQDKFEHYSYMKSNPTQSTYFDSINGQEEEREKN